MKCQNCTEITSGHSIAVREIDGASHNSVENVRELIDSFRTAPPPASKYKIYIIDEVHMLSIAAFNALLKSLEEPPKNTVFILATTEPHKILPTVISRCQRFDLKALAAGEIQNSIANILKEEKIEADAATVQLVSRLAEGSLRDAQSLLERIIAFADNNQITVEQASEALGVVAKPVLMKLSREVFAQNPNDCLQILNDVFASGIDPMLFLREFVTHWRELLLAKTLGGDTLVNFGIDQLTQVEMMRQVESVSLADLQDLTDLARSGADASLRSNYLRYALEALLVRMASRVPVVDIAGLISGADISSLTTSQQKKNSKETAKKTLKVAPKPQAKEVKTLTEESAVTTEQKDHKLDWRDFVSAVSSSRQIVLSENLKRLAVKKFATGMLVADGPEFSIKYLNEAETKAKLIQALKSFSDLAQWKIKFNVVENASIVPGSMQAVAKEKQETRQTDRKADLMSQDQVKDLKELFPNSEVERFS